MKNAILKPQNKSDMAYLERVAGVIMHEHPRSQMTSRLQSIDFEAWSREGFETTKKAVYDQPGRPTMPSYINIQNNLTACFSVNTTVSPSLSGSDWGVDSSSASSGQTTRIFWMNRNEGVHDGDTWIFTTAFTYAGVDVVHRQGQRGGAQTGNPDGPTCPRVLRWATVEDEIGRVPTVCLPDCARNSSRVPGLDRHLSLQARRSCFGLLRELIDAAHTAEVVKQESHQVVNSDPCQLL